MSAHKESPEKGKIDKDMTAFYQVLGILVKNYIVRAVNDPAGVRDLVNQIIKCTDHANQCPAGTAFDWERHRCYVPEPPMGG